MEKIIDKQKLCDLYNGSDIDALEYMNGYLDGDLKILCVFLIHLNNHTTLGWGTIAPTYDEDIIYHKGKWTLLNHFGIKNSYGDAVIE